MAGFSHDRGRCRRPGAGRAAKSVGGGQNARGRAKAGGVGVRTDRGRLGKRRTQAERSARSERGLLRAALELIAERGFRASSLQAIGERAGYSRGLVSHRFGSNEGLLRELVTRMLDRWGTEVRDPAVGNRVGGKALATVASVHRTALEGSPEAVRALYMLLFESLVDMPQLRGEMGRLDRRLRDGAERSLRAGMRAGTVRSDVDVPAQAALFLAVLRGITLQWLIDPSALDLERVYRELEASLLRGLAP
jgi:AcrR family transcriptional regulator